MAKSKYEYVKGFEQDAVLLPETYSILRIDGKAFHKFSNDHSFQKPNDIRALKLMNHCAACVINQFQEIICAYGESDEYSFLFSKDTNLFNRRKTKIETLVVSYFSSCYVFYWSHYFKKLTTNQEESNNEVPLQYPPCFDGRIISYPNTKNIRDYFSWRQVDCHINNLYNTCFWALVHSGSSHQEAEKTLSGTLSEDKQELLFTKFSINYNNIPQIYKKGTFLAKKKYLTFHSTNNTSSSNGSSNSRSSSDDKDNEKKEKGIEKQEEVEKYSETFPKEIIIIYDDIISDKFWEINPLLLPDFHLSQRQRKKSKLMYSNSNNNNNNNKSDKKSRSSNNISNCSSSSNSGDSNQQ